METEGLDDKAPLVDQGMSFLEAVDSTREAVQHDKDIGSARSALDTRFDYMVRFLEEGGCPNSSGKQLKDNVRQNVMQLNKSTMEWKRTPRTLHELECQVKDLDATMMSTVQSLNAQ